MKSRNQTSTVTQMTSKILAIKESKIFTLLALEDTHFIFIKNTSTLYSCSFHEPNNFRQKGFTIENAINHFNTCVF